jgi:hypothetical protein
MNVNKISEHISLKEICSLVQNSVAFTQFAPIIEVYLSTENNKLQVEKFKNSLINYFYNNKNEIELPVETSLADSIKYTANEELIIRFSTHPEDEYSFSPVPIEIIVDALKNSFGRHFKRYIENKYTVYKNGVLLTRRN